MKFILGIDQGSSKTNAIVGSESGNILGMGISGGACHSIDGLDTALGRIREAAGQAFIQAGIGAERVSILAAGMTGLDWKDEEPPLRKALQDEFGADRTKVVNDCLMAMRSGTDKESACVLCAGSGLNCAIKDHNGREFVYGYYIPDEFQGGASIGRRAVQAVIDAGVGLRERTVMTEPVLEQFRVRNVDSLLKKRVAGVISDKEYMSLSLVVEQAALANDGAALEILTVFGTGAARFAVKGIERFSMLERDIDLVLSGSVFKCRASALREATALEIHRRAPKVRIVEARYEPIVGALLTGIDLLYGRAPISAVDKIDECANLFPILRAAGGAERRCSERAKEKTE